MLLDSTKLTLNETGLIKIKILIKLSEWKIERN